MPKTSLRIPCRPKDLDFGSMKQYLHVQQNTESLTAILSSRLLVETSSQDLANAMVGGDNASRAIAVGQVLGAYHGVDAIPRAFKEGLNQWEHSEELLSKLPLLSGNGIENKSEGEL